MTQKVLYSGVMKQELTVIKLGENHFYFISRMGKVLMSEFLRYSDYQKSKISNHPGGFVSNQPGMFGCDLDPKKIMVSDDGQQWFHGYRQYSPSEVKRSMPPRFNEFQCRLTEELRVLFDPIKSFCDIHQVGLECLAVYEKQYADNLDLIAFENYVRITK